MSVKEDGLGVGRRRRSWSGPLLLARSVRAGPEEQSTHGAGSVSSPRTSVTPVGAAPASCAASAVPSSAPTSRVAS